MRLATILLFGALAAACATPAPDKASTTAVAEAQGEKKVCKRITMTGSNMPTTQCRSAAEWEAVNKVGRKDVEEFERSRDNVTSLGQ